MKQILKAIFLFFIFIDVIASDALKGQINEEVEMLAKAVAENPSQFVFYRKDKNGKDWGVAPYWTKKPSGSTITSVNNKLKVLSDNNKTAIVYFSYLFVEHGIDNATLNKKMAALKKTITEDANFIALNKTTGILWVIKIDRRKQDQTKARETIWVEYLGKADLEAQCTQATNNGINTLIKEKKVSFITMPDQTLQTYADLLVKELKECKKIELVERLNVPDEWTAAEIKSARDEINKITDENQKGDMFILLQKKVLYHNQRDNISTATQEDKNKAPVDRQDWVVGVTPIGDYMCNLTSQAMALEMLGYINPSKKQLEDYLEEVRIANGYKDRTIAGERGKIAQKLGFKYDFRDPPSKSKREYFIDLILPKLRKGYGVSLGAGGHIVRVQGITDAGIEVDDPFGKFDLVKRVENGNSDAWTTSNNGTDIAGKDIVWDWESIEKIDVSVVEWFYNE